SLVTHFIVSSLKTTSVSLLRFPHVSAPLRCRPARDFSQLSRRKNAPSLVTNDLTRRSNASRAERLQPLPTTNDTGRVGISASGARPQRCNAAGERHQIQFPAQRSLGECWRRYAQARSGARL